jgi:dehydrogenase/reductase SDR family protein 4
MATQRFTGKNVIVTGGTRGIGRAVVERLLQEGARVCFSARKEASVTEAVAELAAVHGSHRVAGVVADLSRDNRVDLVARAAELWDGQVHGLVLNAAISPPVTSVLEADQRAFDKILGTNVTANALIVKEAAQYFVDGEAAVVFISSVAAYRPAFPLPVYGVYILLRVCLCASQRASE